jgi:hypothetical protein
MEEQQDKRKAMPHLFQKGQSGNPSGRPKSPNKTLTQILEEVGEIEDVELKRGQNKIARKEALAHKMWNMALSGKENVARYIYDRIDGKPTQEIKVGGNVKIDAPIHLHIGAKIEAVDEATESGTPDSDET